ncbi:MAG TPA: prolyl oligopeptidase family serine peptidase, partial [Burkholderiaceae bacterium]
EDARQAVWWLREHAATLGIDPHRVLALGGSAGALLAGWLGTSDRTDARGTHSRADAVVSLWGPWDLTVVPPREDARHMVDALLGAWPARSASPIFRIDPRASPTLFIHGTADTLVPPGQSTRACEALRASGVHCEVVLLDGEGHGPAHTDVGGLLSRIVAFAAKVLPRPVP